VVEINEAFGSQALASIPRTRHPDGEGQHRRRRHRHRPPAWRNLRRITAKAAQIMKREGASRARHAVHAVRRAGHRDGDRIDPTSTPNWMGALAKRRPPVFARLKNNEPQDRAGPPLAVASSLRIRSRNLGGNARPERQRRWIARAYRDLHWPACIWIRSIAAARRRPHAGTCASRRTRPVEAVEQAVRNATACRAAQIPRADHQRG